MFEIELFKNKFRIDEKYKFTCIITSLLFFITHAYFFLGRYANEDYLHSVLGSSQRITSGRWLGEIYSSYLIPWVLGFICCLLMIITVCFLISLFEVSNKIVIFLISGLMVTFPNLAYGFGYLFMSDIYMISLCSAVISVWITSRFKFGFIGGAFFLMISLAEYQSYIGVAMALSLFKLIYEFIQCEKSDKECLSHIVRYLLMGVFGVLLYFIGLKICLHVSNLTLSNYKGIDKMGMIPIHEIPRLLIKTYTKFLGFFVGLSFYYTHPLLTISYILSISSSFLLSIHLYRKNLKLNNIKNSFFRTVLILILILFIPLCCNPVDFMAPDAGATNLNIYAVVFVFVFPLILLQSVIVLNKRLINLAIIIPAAFIVINNYVLSNVYYLKISAYYEQTSLFYNRLLTRIEVTDGFEEDMPIAVFSSSSPNFYGISSNDFKIIRRDPGLFGRYIAINRTNPTRRMTGFMKNMFGVHLEAASDEDIEKLRTSPEFSQLKTYPAKDSIKVIDGMLVINFAPSFSLEAVMDNETIKFKLNNYDSQKDKYQLAWYLYRDNQRIDVKWYSQTDHYEYFIEEPGEYHAVCFIKNINNDSTFTLESKKITIK